MMLPSPSRIGGAAHLADEISRVRTYLVLLSSLLLAVAPPAPSTVVVDYAGSLVTPMEGPIATALSKDGVTFEGEARGSKAIAHLIEAGLRSPDVFISADRRLVRELAGKGLVATSTTFAGGSLVLGYAPHSPKRALFEAVAAHRSSVAALLHTPGLRIGRTDPALDPKGQRTLEAMRLLGVQDEPGEIYPEQDLLVRVETGAVDCAFLYSTEAIARHLPYLALPGKASLTGEITYTLVIMKHAPHPNAARRFARFILDGSGRTILKQAGLTYR